MPGQIIATRQWVDYCSSALQLILRAQHRKFASSPHARLITTARIGGSSLKQTYRRSSSEKLAATAHLNIIIHQLSLPALTPGAIPEFSAKAVAAGFSVQPAGIRRCRPPDAVRLKVKLGVSRSDIRRAGRPTAHTSRHRHRRADGRGSAASDDRRTADVTTQTTHDRLTNYDRRCRMLVRGVVRCVLSPVRASDATSRCQTDHETRGGATDKQQRSTPLLRPVASRPAQLGPAHCSRPVTAERRQPALPAATLQLRSAARCVSNCDVTSLHTAGRAPVC